MLHALGIIAELVLVAGAFYGVYRFAQWRGVVFPWQDGGK